MSEIDDRIRFQHPDQVLLEERIVQMGQMSPDELVVLQFARVILQILLERLQAPILERLGDSLHSLQVLLVFVLLRHLHCEDRC